MAAKLRKIRPYEEAVHWISKLQLKSYRAWAKWIANNPLPLDIPRNPYLAYKKRGVWKSWEHFLGTTPEARMEHILETIVSIAFVNTSDSPGNVYNIFITPHGEDYLKKKAHEANFKIAKVYRIKAPMKDKFLEYVQKLKSGYFGEAERIILSNPISTFSDLDELAEYINSRPE